jgi:hypothetical protein
VSYRVDLVYLSEVKAALERAQVNIEDFGELWDRIGMTMADHVQETFDTAGFGFWDPLQMRTIETKVRLGYEFPEDPMIRRGDLLDSLLNPEEAGKVEQGFSTIGTFTGKAYSYGTEVPNDRGQTFAQYHADHPDHNPNLPIRDPIMVTPKLLEEIEEDSKDFLRDAFREAGIEPRG